MTVPVDFSTVFARCKRVLQRQGQTLTALEYEGGLPPIVWLSELRQNGKTRAVPDLWKLAQDLQVVESVEVPNGEWAAMHEKC